MDRVDIPSCLPCSTQFVSARKPPAVIILSAPVRLAVSSCSKCVNVTRCCSMFRPPVAQSVCSDLAALLLNRRLVLLTLPTGPALLCYTCARKWMPSTRGMSSKHPLHIIGHTTSDVTARPQAKVSCSTAACASTELNGAKGGRHRKTKKSHNKFHQPCKGGQ